MIHIIDLHFMGHQRVIASYVITEGGSTVLIDPGPFSCIEQLTAGLRKIQVQIEDIDAILLTHIHFDHGGAAWYFARRGIPILVHPVGLPHMINPAKLYASATRIYGDQMSVLWGAMEPIPADQISPLQDEQCLVWGTLSIQAFYSPGHAKHHCMFRYKKTLFSGDVGGVRIGEGPIIAPTPPPDIQLIDWRQSLQRIQTIKPHYIAPTHFGIHSFSNDWVQQIETHLLQLEHLFDEQTDQMKLKAAYNRFVEDLFEPYHLDKKSREAYEWANPTFMGIAGMQRYAEQKRRYS